MLTVFFRTSKVEKPIPVEYDFGNLAVFDTNPLDEEKLESSETKEEELKNVTRDNIQLLVGQLLMLPVKKTTASVNSSEKQDSTMTLFTLPPPTTALPREKALPKEKPKTKWEKFAAEKGIKKKAKDGKLVYDEETGQWIPKWGYNGANKKLDNQWLVELPENSQKPENDFEDPRALGRQERLKLVKKNQKQHEKNAKKAMGI